MAASAPIRRTGRSRVARIIEQLYYGTLLRPLLTSALAALLGVLAVMMVPGCGDDPDDGAGAGDGTTGSSGSSGTSSGDPTTVAGSSGGPSSSLTLSSEQKQGIATFYDYSGTTQVACSFDITSDTDVAAINVAEYAKSAACGSCVNVSGPKGKVVVRLVDRCPSCVANHLDLSAQAFAKIADPKAGRVPITYQLVSCPVPGNMSYRIKEGSSKFWTAIQVRDHTVPVAKVEYKKNGVYTNMPRADYNYFIDAKGVGDQPNGIALRITAADGRVVEDVVPSIVAGKVFPGVVQFK